jgi:MFS family permease
VFTTAYVGTIVGPIVVGLIADHVGLRAGFTVPVVLCAVAALAAGAIRDPRG